MKEEKSSFTQVQGFSGRYRVRLRNWRPLAARLVWSYAQKAFRFRVRTFGTLITLEGIGRLQAICSRNVDTAGQELAHKRAVAGVPQGEARVCPRGSRDSCTLRTGTHPAW